MVYEDYKKMGLSIDLSRGKPSKEQLDISNSMLNFNKYISESGLDCRNYSLIDGTIEARRLFCEIFDCNYEEVFVGGNSSLNLLYEILNIACIKGFRESKGALFNEKRKLLCPCPGYDRHFKIGEYLGFELIPIKMSESGPDMDKIEEMVLEDDSIKGIFCVPLYSNPDGYVYSNETVFRFARLKTKAKDFKIFWDNAYMLHHFSGEEIKIPNLLKEAKKYGNQDKVYMFFSTSKITFPGAGVAGIASSNENIEWLKNNLSVSRICFDKLNELSQVSFLKDLESIKSIMNLHAQYIKPKFDIAFKIFNENFGERNELISWTKAKGGYFMSLYLKPGYAKKVYERCKDAGLILTNPGDAFPYSRDVLDSHIRFAPTYSTLEEIEVACNLLSCVIKEFVC